MISHKPSLLYITDLYYKANNREYYKEDLFITSQLCNDFNLLICNPLHSYQFEEIVDLIVIRNSGPVIYYKQYFDEFFERINRKRLRCYNALNGQGDMLGKEYLITLTKEKFPVIPTVDKLADLHLLPPAGKFVVKPKEGADSIGMRFLSLEQLQATVLNNELIQPHLDFIYEVSFYFIDTAFQYALYAPDKSQRWRLEEYKPSPEDLAFAEAFVQWNTMTHGIQRVDACRTQDGRLLLVELEDLNPFLSIDLVGEETRQQFVINFRNALHKAIQTV